MIIATANNLLLDYVLVISALLCYLYPRWLLVAVYQLFNDV